MFEQEHIFNLIKLTKGACFLDLGCGAGDYAIRASNIVGERGKVIAVDAQKQVIDDLRNRIEMMEIRNIEAINADITKPLPIENDCVDICFIATVLHTIDIKKNGDVLFKEISRVLKKTGARLITIDCKKEDTPWGPPKNMRISPEELVASISPCGFQQLKYIDLEHFYMIQFSVIS
jgi:FkbM family methyltransferase